MASRVSESWVNGKGAHVTGDRVLAGSHCLHQCWVPFLVCISFVATKAQKMGRVGIETTTKITTATTPKSFPHCLYVFYVVLCCFALAQEQGTLDFPVSTDRGALK